MAVKVKRRKRKRKPAPLTAAQQEFVMANRGLIGVATKNQYYRHLSTYELDQEGAIALAMAVKGFRKSKGFRFSTYAATAIRNALKRRDQEGSLIHVPHYLRSEAGKASPYRKDAEAVDGMTSIQHAMTEGFHPESPEDEESEFGYRAMRAVGWAIRKLDPVERDVIRSVVIRGETTGGVRRRHALSAGDVSRIKLQAFAKLRARLQKHV